MGAIIAPFNHILFDCIDYEFSICTVWHIIIINEQSTLYSNYLPICQRVSLFCCKFKLYKIGFTGVINTFKAQTLRVSSICGMIGIVFSSFWYK